MRTAGVPTPTVPGPPGHPLVHRFQTDRPDLAFVPPHPWRSSLSPIPPALHTGGYPYVPLRQPPPRPAFLEGYSYRPLRQPLPPFTAPPPLRGRESDHGDTGRAVPEQLSRRFPGKSRTLGSPRAVDRGGVIWGEGPGGLPLPQACVLSSALAPGGRAVRGIPGKNRPPDANSQKVEKR